MALGTCLSSAGRAPKGYRYWYVLYLTLYPFQGLALGLCVGLGPVPAQ